MTFTTDSGWPVCWAVVRHGQLGKTDGRVTAYKTIPDKEEVVSARKHGVQLVQCKPDTKGRFEFFALARLRRIANTDITVHVFHGCYDNIFDAMQELQKMKPTIQTLSGPVPVEYTIQQYGSVDDAKKLGAACAESQATKPGWPGLWAPSLPDNWLRRGKYRKKVAEAGALGQSPCPMPEYLWAWHKNGMVNSMGGNSHAAFIAAKPQSAQSALINGGWKMGKFKRQDEPPNDSTLCMWALFHKHYLTTKDILANNDNYYWKLWEVYTDAFAAVSEVARTHGQVVAYALEDTP